jgi:hypothetical protein
MGFDRACRLARGASTLSRSMSSGSVSTTGPGRPDVATEGAGDEFGDAGGIVDLAHPFGEFGEGAAELDLLEGLALAGVALDLADEQDHRDRILPGDVQAGGGVGGAGAAGDHADAGLAGEPAPGVGHHRGAAFLAADDDLDVAVIERVEHGEETLAGHAGEALDAVRLQCLDDQFSAGSFHVGFFLSHSASSASTSS